MMNEKKAAAAVQSPLTKQWIIPRIQRTVSDRRKAAKKSACLKRT